MFLFVTHTHLVPPFHSKCEVEYVKREVKRSKKDNCLTGANSGRHLRSEQIWGSKARALGEGRERFPLPNTMRPTYFSYFIIINLFS